MITLRSFTICFVFGFSMICENIVFAQNISSNWKSVVDSVNTYYKNANFEKKIAVEYLLNNIPYHTSKYDQKLSSYYNKRKRIRDASRYTSKKISLKLLFLSDIFLFPFVRQQFPVLA